MPITKQSIPKGFCFSAAEAAVKAPGRKDIALIFSEVPAVAAGVFTTNKIKAAPVKLDIANISSGKAQAIIVNSGNANACTGRQGFKDAKETIEVTAKHLGIDSKLVYVSSTGVIGRAMPMERIKKAIPLLAKALSRDSLDDVAKAIMTTDTFPKIFFKTISINGKTGNIAAIAKGAGMISPNMATMLCFILTDIAVEQKALQEALRNAVDISFNRLTIDSDMSTNDTVLVMANGMLGNAPLKKNSPYYSKFEKALSDTAYNLSKMIALDGEGATKLIIVRVKRAKTSKDAEIIARAIANSPLVKTAIYGNDPNWGRIIAAIGYSGIDVIEEKIGITINNVKIVKGGLGIPLNKNSRGIFSKKEVVIEVDIGTGKNEAEILTCDLTEEYIKVNASYTT
ncbi:MAG: bifunctional glutamate N-acetyltransferase/amino-acid acetyltransferase ArgJ [Nitrospirae bacterium]|nr:bifunctional glutamate N-acetyltransferase/amino-acid acetyltransferase ArgJ [Nitrospirota bacterium]